MRPAARRSLGAVESSGAFCQGATITVPSVVHDSAALEVRGQPVPSSSLTAAWMRAATATPPVTAQTSDRSR